MPSCDDSRAESCDDSRAESCADSCADGCADRQHPGMLRRYAMPDPARILQEAYDNVRHEYGTAIGQRRDELITPALVLDIDAAQRNIDHMASELKRIGGATIRPHYKTHKSPDLARRQLQAGAGGVCLAPRGGGG